MADTPNTTETTEADWSVSEAESATANQASAKLGKEEDDKGEFLLNLLSSYSRHRLLPLTELPREDLIHAFLGGGIHEPRVMTFYLSEEQVSRLTSLMAVPVSKTTRASPSTTSTRSPPILPTCFWSTWRIRAETKRKRSSAS